MAHRDPAVRLWQRVQKTDECWLWSGWTDRNGYGRMRIDGRSVGVHRVAYELLVGPIPDGLHVDHLCKVRNCVRPEHLEPVTARENWRRSAAITVGYAARTHCLRGHPFDEANTYTHEGTRYCRACGRLRSRKYKASMAERAA